MITTGPCDRVVVVGASAGGVEAISELLAALPPTLNAAICVVTHIPAHTPSSLHRILAQKTPMPVLPAEDGEALQAGRVYVGVADRHLMLSDGATRLTRGPKESRSRPSVDVLFRSAAMYYGPRAIGVVLSGMLDDGTAGLWAIKDEGGVALVQDPGHAQYPSMPDSAIRHVDVDFVGSLEALAAEIVHLVAQPVSAELKPPLAFQRHALENMIAGEGNALQRGVMGLGKVSKYTCPECHGVLVQVEEGSILRFRCHTGHAFSIKSLLVGVGEAIDEGLWDTIRALEERVLLLRQMSVFAQDHETAAVAERSSDEADHLEERIDALRGLVLDPYVSGHRSDG